MHRMVFIFGALVVLSLGGCTVHHSASASASVRASGSASSSGSGRGVDHDRSDDDEGSRRVGRERAPSRLVVRRPPANRRPPHEAPETDEEPQPEEDEPVFGSPVATDGAFAGNVYLLPEDTEALPDLDALEPVGTVYAKKLDIEPRRFDEGFPGISDRFEWFAIRYTATVAVDEAGEYEFRLHSDDGSKLYVDGQLVVDNDGVHPPDSASGKVRLDAGAHEFVVEYFQGPRYEIALQLFVTPPGGEEGIFSLE